MSAQVTATGIRDGDPAVLHALVNRRGGAVLAYCERACAPGSALDAAADAFVRFRAQVLAADRPGDINPESALLSATRHAAASRAPRPPARSGATGLGRLLGGRAPTDVLPDVPDLLADRANGLIAPGDDQALTALLDTSPVARSMEERFEAAEAAYRDAPRLVVPEPIIEQIVATMGALAAAPTNGAPSATAVEPMSPPGPADPLPPAPRFFPTDPPQPAVEEPELAEEELTPTDERATIEWQTDEAVDVDAAVPDSAEIAATRGEDAEPDGTLEWSVPADELGESPELEHEIAAARLPDESRDEDPGHLQSASGAVAADDAEDAATPLPPAPPPSAPAPHHHRHGLPGRAALAPAAAVVAVAAIGAMAASGVLGGNDPSPTVDTGIVPERALQAIPEGEASAVVDDLRAASADARRRRLADQRRQIAAQPAAPEPVEETTTITPGEGTATTEQAPTTTGDTPAPATTGTTAGGAPESP